MPNHQGRQTNIGHQAISYQKNAPDELHPMRSSDFHAHRLVEPHAYPIQEEQIVVTQ
jgi:hypothetical protein